MKNQFHLLEMVQKGFLSSLPWYVVLYVTAHCNSRCKFCFYWEQIDAADRKKELTLEEMEKISKGLPSLYQLTLTGGEPFVRKDIDQIILIFYKNAHVRRFTIPTNGYFTTFMLDVLEKSLAACPTATISINFSLDNLGEAHDEVRGLPGNFKRMLETIKVLKTLKGNHPNLSLAAATTASSFNVNDLIQIIDFVYDHDLFDNYGIMLARGNVREGESKDFPLEKYWAAVRYHLSRMQKRSFMRPIMQTLYETKKKTLEEKRMVDVCLSGKKMIIISERGHVYPCELLPPFVPEGGLNYSKEEGIRDFSFGNLREYDYDTRRLLSTHHARRVQDYIQNRKCWCTFECATINNFFFSPSAYARVTKNALRPSENHLL